MPETKDVDGLAHQETAAVESAPGGLISGTTLLENPDAFVDLAGGGPRYEPRETLGEGGMGEVRLCRDARIGREIAMKVIRSDKRDVVALRQRFLREARVQAQLEHPAIVPVYDLGQGEDGAPFFVMRRLRGETLASVVDALAQGDTQAEGRYTRHALLSLFTRVCLAVDYAHARGVVHRDLKPSNVMLGRFGEVYLLDWGVAKVKSASETLDPLRTRESVARLTAAIASDEGAVDVAGGATETGALLGTAGYMAPEQIIGAEVDHQADVYALGTILFELLTLAPLNGSGTTSGLLQRTLRPNLRDVEARLTGANVPPELARICLRATALRPSERHRSARALADEVEAYLAGDRDVELRREQVDRHLSAAAAATERALTPSQGDADQRREALAEIGRALALDPTRAEARALLVKLLTEPPRELPDEVVAATSRQRRANLRRTLVRAAVAYSVAGVAVLALGLLVGVRQPSMLLLAASGWFVTAGVALLTRRTPKLLEGPVPFTSLSVLGASALVGLLYGPLVLAPVVVSLNAAGLVFSGSTRDRRWVTPLAALTIALPVVAAWLGVPPVVRAMGDHLHLDAGALAIPSYMTPLVALVHVGVLVGALLFLGGLRDTSLRAETREQLRTWQLSQLVSSSLSDVSPRRPRKGRRARDA